MSERTRFVKLHIVPEHAGENFPDGDIWFNVERISNIAPHHSPRYAPHGTRVETHDGIMIVRESVDEVLAAIAEAEVVESIKRPNSADLQRASIILGKCIKENAPTPIDDSLQKVADWLEKVAEGQS